MFDEIKKYSQNAQAVTQAQTLLRACGYIIGVDGNFGDKTEAIIKQFQGDNNLVADGIVGEKTWQVLFLKANNHLSATTMPFKVNFCPSVG